MKPTRRQLLVHGLGATAALPLAAGLPWLPPRRVRGDERVLVVIQLTGGNDGLNTVVPRTQDAYYRLRPTLALGRGALHALDEAHGLHPSMGAMAELFDAGKLAVVHGVGHGLAERSHFRSMEIWHTASRELPRPDTGWLGRLADQLAARTPGRLVALHVGEGALPLSLRGRRSRAPSVRDPKGLRLVPDLPELATPRLRILGAGPAEGDLAFLRAAAESAYEAAERMGRLTGRPSPVPYPDSELGRSLRLVAGLVAGRFGTRVFQVELGGFDLHARQAKPHEHLLATLSDALGAFQADLARNGDEERVLTFAFSEFGRRAAENGSRGTDHGAGAPVFLVGPRVRAGLFGTPPDLERLEDGDVPTTTDFRAVYATLEERWMGLTPSSDLAPLPLLG
jgi:uncharacterized protein (DUF1501 family)